MNSKPRRRSKSGARRSGHRSQRDGGRHPVEPLHPISQAPRIDSFSSFDLAPEVLAEIGSMGIQKPTPIQALSIPPALEGRDLIAKAETGTGKTLAFGAPLATRIDANRASVLGLVLCPTRELAHQVYGVLRALGRRRNLSVALIVGGEPIHPQIDALKAGAQVVVGTPGRVLDLSGQGFLAFPWTEIVVLDEADEMLEIGFIDDVRKILRLTPEERQTMLFSATFPVEVLSLAREATRNPVEVATAAGHATVDTIDQSWIAVPEGDRTSVLVDLIRTSEADDVFLVFCDRRTEVDALLRRLSGVREPIKALHGGYDQPSRTRVMNAFRSGEVKALLATDVASRGLDIHLVTHVINYSVPSDISDYTHRIGRTGRAGRSGSAITLVTPREGSRWRGILRDANWTIAETAAPSVPTRGGNGRAKESRGGNQGERNRRGGKRRQATPREENRRVANHQAARTEASSSPPKARRARRRSRS